MKKRVFIFIFLLLALIPFLVADENEITISEETDEDDKVEKAYDCLKDKIEDRECDDLSLEEQIFSLLAVGKCRSEVNDDSKSDECWPKSGCKIKTTAQAILALKGDSKAEEWLISQNTTTSDLNWYLQIDSSEPTSCTIEYTGSSSTINIGEDKKINSAAGSCLPLSSGDYWFRILPSCYDEEFEISCNQGFYSNLLFKKSDSPTIHVSEKTNSASAEGSTTEKINSYCFGNSASCDYEGSLWAALVLDKEDYDVTAFYPYLITMAEESDNEKYLPEAFLYALLGDVYRNDLLMKQKTEGWWSESGNKYYDTALALYPISDEPLEKQKTQEWLLGAQDDDGCWQGNILNTAFLLHSLWPRATSGGNGDGDDEDCEDKGYYCLTKLDCEGLDGTEMGFGGCSGAQVCCDEDKPLSSCSELNGDVCNSGERCVGGRQEEVADDLSSGEICCVGGRCEESSTPTTSECEDNGGICEDFCRDGYETNFLYDCGSDDFCCMKETKKSSYIWIWILIILIILVVVGIMFKDKLRRFWFKLKSKFGGSRPGPGPGGPFFSPPPSSTMPIRRAPRRIMPPRRRAPARRPPARKKPTDFDNVLKKLKEIGG